MIMHIKEIVDKIFNKLGYISHKEHTKRYDKIVDAYEKIIRELKDKPQIIPERRVGNSTRLIDYYIQELFNKGKVEIIDHYSGYKASRRLLKIIVRRLDIEHQWTRGRVNVDRMKFILTLPNQTD